MIQSNTNKVIGKVNLRCATSKGTKPHKSQHHLAQDGPVDNRKKGMTQLCNDSSAVIDVPANQMSAVCPAIYAKGESGFKSLQ